MASVYELRGTSFNSFFVGKQGPTLAKTGVRDLTISAVPSTTTNGGGINISGADGVNAGGDINLTVGNHTGVGTIGGISLISTGTGVGETADLRFLELAANGANYVGFKSPDAIAANQIWVLPNADGGDGDTLTTDGVGNLTWSSPSIFEVYSSIAQTITGTPTVINLTTARIANVDFTIGVTGIITVNRAGTYVLTYSVTTDSINSTRTGVRSEIFINGVLYPSSAAYTYNRLTTVGENTAGRTMVAVLTIGDTVEIRSTRVAGTGAITIANESNLVFERKGP